MSRESALSYLRSHQVMTLATAGEDGVWAAAVFYVNEGFDLYFLSAQHTRHARHIASDGRVAATIHEDYDGWEAIQGIQLEGVARVLEGAERETAILLYEEKYPFVAQADQQIQAALARVDWYRLRPEALYFIDNSRGFGFRDRVL